MGEGEEDRVENEGERRRRVIEEIDGSREVEGREERGKLKRVGKGGKRGKMKA